MVFKQFYRKICGLGLRKHRWRYSVRSKVAAVITVKILEHFSGKLFTVNFFTVNFKKNFP